MKKVLLVYHALSSGEFKYAGMEKMLVWLGNSLANIGYDVTFCTLFDHDRCKDYSSNVKSIELNIPYHKSFYKRNLATFLIAPLKLHKVLKNNYDYVVNFGDTVFFLVLGLKMFFKYSLVTSERGDPYSNANRLERARRNLIKYSNIIVFQTPNARDYFDERVKNKSTVIPNPISLPVLQWDQLHTKKHIIFVGRIDFWQKRPDLLVDAFALVFQKHPDYELHICGSGKAMARLKSHISKLGLDNNIVLHGAVNNVTEHLLQSEIFVLTSDFEGIPNALLEAMALGMPVVSTDCSPGGASFLINNNINGQLVPRGNAQAIAEAICYYIEHRNEAKIHAKEARNSVMRFDPSIIVQQWANVMR